MNGSVPSQNHREGHNFPVVPTKGSQNTRLKPLLPRPASAAEPAGERLTIRIRVRLQAYRSDATVTHAPIRRNDPNRLVEKELASVDIAVQIAKTAGPRGLNLQYHRHDQRSLLCLLGDVALQIAADFFFDHAVVGFLFFTRLFQGLHHDLPRTVHKAIFARRKASSDYLR